MPLDPSIILGAKPVQVDFDKFSPVNALTSAMKMRQLEQEGDLNALNLSQRKGLQDFLVGNPDLKSPETRYKLATEFGEPGRKVAEGVVNIDKSKTEQLKQMGEKAKIAGNMLAGVTDDIGWQRVRPRLQQLAPDEQLPEVYDPKYIAETQQEALGIEKALERHFMKQDTGRTEHVLSMPKYGPGSATVVPGSSVTKTVSPDAAARLAAETATGTLTPESLDVAANVYLQTGQLPTGLGKAAAGLRTQVMNRATELSTGKSAADVAGGIIEAKQDVAGRGKAVKDFGTGKQGDAVRSFNTAIDHLDTMSKLATALENKDTRLFNTVGNAFAKATGQAAPTDFDTAKAIVGGEVAKALTGSNMALKDREEVRESISRANSPEQLAGSVRRMQELMGGQLNSLDLQYRTSTGRKDFDNKLTPRSKEVLKDLRGGEQKAAPAATANVVTLPDGRSMSFPNAKAAADFKKAAGL